MKLTDSSIKEAERRNSVYKMYDGKGMYLEVPPTGNKRWRLKYRFLKKEKKLSLGIYPEVSLDKARERCLDARELLYEGKDPSLERKNNRKCNQDIKKLIQKKIKELDVLIQYIYD